MNPFASLLIWAGICAGFLITGLLICHTLMAIVRLALAWHLPPAIDLLLDRLSTAAWARSPWEPVLRGLRLCLPWPWPWRLERAARQVSAGVGPTDLLRHGSLLPKALREQAAQALAQGPDAFAMWCTSVRSGSGASSNLVRQGAFLLAEFTAVALFTYFMIIVVMPKFEMILRELGIQNPPFLTFMTWLGHYGWAPAIIIALLALGLAALGLSLLWRRKRRLAAAYLLLSGSQARLPEAALGTADGRRDISPTFAELCATKGWQADSPVALMRAVIRAERRRRRLAAWLPAVVAALGPLVLAIPVGAVVLGTMQILITILYQIETPS